MNWYKNIKSLSATLESLSVRDDTGKEIDPNVGFTKWMEVTQQVRKDRNTVYLIGNGASASLASHMAADFAKNARVHTEVFSDLSLITAIANDDGYENVFAEPLRRRMETGDMLVAISSSGNSDNILRAMEVANDLGGIGVTITGMDEDNRLRKMGQMNFYIPARSYGLAETAHAAILHYWMDLTVIKVR